jgi:dolichol-phosphate mannosyltransferase
MGPEKGLISILSPVYGCHDSLSGLFERIGHAVNLTGADFELILVNDASPDNSWEVIQKLAKKDKRIKGICFRRISDSIKQSLPDSGMQRENGFW